MKTLCIVPARGGSKRLPNKNIRMLDNRPLVCHTINAVLKNFDKVIFTSDSDDIVECVNEYYFKTPKTFLQRLFKKTILKDHATNLQVEKRPQELATDTSKVIDTVEYYFKKYGSEYDQIWLSLPTCPLRTSKDVSNAKKILTKDIDSVITITEYDFPPTLALNKDGDDLVTDYDSSKPWQTGNTRSQDHPTIYRPNGALYGSWSTSFSKNLNYYKGKVKGSFMTREHSVDIDNEIDFLLAQQLISSDKPDYRDYGGWLYGWM